LAPEMVSGEPDAVDARTDVFLLGATLHEVLVGEPRNPGFSLVEVLVAAEKCEPYAFPDGVPPELASICNRACARDPVDRFASAEAFRRALEEYLALRDARTLLHAAQQHAQRLDTLIESEAD